MQFYTHEVRLRVELMIQSPRERLISLLSETPVMQVSDLHGAGVTRHTVVSAERDGVVMRPARGFICSLEAYDHPRVMDVVVSVMTGGVIAYSTAAIRHGLTEAMPDGIDVIVPDGYTRPPTSVGVRCIRSRLSTSFSVGVETETLLGHDVRMTDAARTVVDHYRFGAPRQFTLHALQAFLHQAGEEGGLLGTAVALGSEERLVDALSNDIESYLLAVGRAPGL